jgi:hypothetical protein
MWFAAYTDNEELDYLLIFYWFARVCLRTTVWRYVIISALFAVVSSLIERAFRFTNVKHCSLQRHHNIVLLSVVAGPVNVGKLFEHELRSFYEQLRLLFPLAYP